MERRSRHEVFGDVEAAPRGLEDVVTNGAGCLQREKLTASGLSTTELDH